MTGSELNARAVRAGLIGGIAVIYLALAGMIEKFDSRNLIGDFLTLGNLLMALPPLLTGFLATRPRLVGGQREAAGPRPALTAGLVSGAVVGGLTAAGVALVEFLPEGAVRRIFIQVSPELLSILTFGRGVPLGLVLLVVYGAVLGLLGAGFRLLPDRYRVVRHIANGGMASVWEAHDELLDRPVAIKVLAAHLSEDDRARRRFAREARTAAGLSSHPHVVTIYDVGEHDGKSFIVMELVGGGTVADRLRAGEERSQKRARAEGSDNAPSRNHPYFPNQAKAVAGRCACCSSLIRRCTIWRIASQALSCPRFTTGLGPRSMFCCCAFTMAMSSRKMSRICFASMSEIQRSPSLKL
mgnify:CR=1 FL=1